MEFIDGLQDALDYIERNLDKELNAADIARHAACSEFYFQRIFGLLCGVPLGEYIRNRRLTLAGSELASTDIKVTDAAFKYRYESPESFARAFGKFHGITPSEAKKKRRFLQCFSPITVKINLKGGILMNYKIVEKQEFHVLERVGSHSTQDAANLSSIPAFWTECRENGTLDTLLKNTCDKTFVFGICYAPKNGADEFDYSVAAACEKDAPVPQGLRKSVIPARTWAVFECVGAMPDAIQTLWQKIVTEFFPSSGYSPTYELDVEAYGDGDMDAADYKSEIWIPVRKNG